jgi:hypothetical protein
MAEHLFQLAAVLLANLGSALLGGVVVWALMMRAHRDSPVPEAEPEPVPARTGMWPVSKTQRLDPVGGETVRIRVRTKGGPQVRPWRWQGQHRGPESLAERPEPLFLADKPFETTEFPRLDWSSRTGELDEVSG